jgi:hypothetical protein
MDLCAARKNRTVVVYPCRAQGNGKGLISTGRVIAVIQLQPADAVIQLWLDMSCCLADR